MFEVRVADLKHYESEVRAYESVPVQTGRILFLGSSGFTRWRRVEGMFHDLEEDILRKDGSPAALNHGIGGSTGEELLYYYDRLVRPYQPRALVLRVVPNDRYQGYHPHEILFILSRLCAWARTDFPGIKLYICDASPNLRNIGDACWLSHVQQFNTMLRDYCDKHDDTTCICHTAFSGFYNDPADVGDYFKVRQDIFIQDNIHFNHEGYKLYRDMFLQALNDIL